MTSAWKAVSVRKISWTTRWSNLASAPAVCEAAEASGVAISAECHSGICGSDPIRILSGAENLVGEMSDQERETLEEICELEPGPCRLACMVRVRGAVEVELIKR